MSLTAQSFYSRASSHIGSFYGQLALAGRTRLPASILPPQPSDLRHGGAGLQQSRAGCRSPSSWKRDRPRRAAPIRSSAGSASLRARPTTRCLRYRLAKVTKSLAAEVSVAKKKMMQAGMPILTDGYPVLAPVPGAPGRPLIHHAASSARKACSTAAPSARRARARADAADARHRQERRQQAPENVRRYKLTQPDPRPAQQRGLLGSAYLADLVDQFSGSYVMAVAGYNGPGPGRVAGWLKDNGDPRPKLDDTIDWIEKIGVGEAPQLCPARDGEISRSTAPSSGMGRGSAPSTIARIWCGS